MPYCACSSENGTCLNNDTGRQTVHKNNDMLKLNINFQREKRNFKKFTKLNDIICLSQYIEWKYNYKKKMYIGIVIIADNIPILWDISILWLSLTVYRHCNYSREYLWHNGIVITLMSTSDILVLWLLSWVSDILVLRLLSWVSLTCCYCDYR